jgi:predicted transglutaminase-like cysteine proteinase
MIKKLVISAVVLTALIYSKEASAFGIGGFTRGLATSGAVELAAADVSTFNERSTERDSVSLTFAKRRELLNINMAVETAIGEVDGYLDGLLGGSALTLGASSCIDCADLKRDHLVALGWSKKAMRIDYSISGDGRIERVLVIATNGGDVVLGREVSALTVATPSAPEAEIVSTSIYLDI